MDSSATVTTARAPIATESALWSATSAIAGLPASLHLGTPWRSTSAQRHRRRQDRQKLTNIFTKVSCFLNIEYLFVTGGLVEGPAGLDFLDTLMMRYHLQDHDESHISHIMCAFNMNCTMCRAISALCTAVREQLCYGTCTPLVCCLFFCRDSAVY